MSNQFNIDGSFDDFLLENDDADEDVVVEERDKNYLTHSLSEDTIGASKNFDDQCGKWYTLITISIFTPLNCHNVQANNVLITALIFSL